MYFIRGCVKTQAVLLKTSGIQVTIVVIAACRRPTLAARITRHLTQASRNFAAAPFEKSLTCATSLLCAYASAWCTASGLPLYGPLRQAAAGIANFLLLRVFYSKLLPDPTASQ